MNVEINEKMLQEFILVAEDEKLSAIETVEILSVMLQTKKGAVEAVRQIKKRA